MSLYFLFPISGHWFKKGEGESVLSLLHKNRSSNLSQSIEIKIQTLLLFLLFGGGVINRTQATTGSLAKTFDVLCSVLLLRFTSACLGAQILMIVV